jgi:apolipoprotein N-acyltransferase
VSRSPRWLLASLGGVLLGFAAPPAMLPFAEWLVLPGLAVWFALALSDRRPLLHSYLFGCAYMAWFSWSVRHVMLPAYLAIVLLGGLYFVLGTAAVRGAPRRLQSLAFAVAVAGSFWLRATMPEIHYPHGQPCHALWQWPSLMRVVTVGGEPLLNALLGLLAATGFGIWQSWRTAVPMWRTAWLRLVGAVMVTVGCAWFGHQVAAGVRPATGAADQKVRLSVIEPGFHPEQIFTAPPEQWPTIYRQLVDERLVAPTRTALQSAFAPDLVLWPESSLAFERIAVADIDAGHATVLAGAFANRPARLVLGANVEFPDGLTPSALLLELPSGRVLARHDKQRLVPGGEFLPLVSVLPKVWADWLRQSFQAALGVPPDCLPGQFRAPLRTNADVPFGALLCYDNAFPGPAAAQVAAGAEFLVVLSNESWYRGGAELTQLVAMTVVRALENAVPIVRCTLDGHSVAVSADGQIIAGLPIAPAPQPAARILEVSIDPGTGRIPPLAWLRRGLGWVFAALTALGAAHTLLTWVRLRSARTALSAAVGSGPSGDSPGGS